MYQRKNLYLSVLLSTLVILTLAGWVNQVQSQEKYPTRAIDLIVPVTPGGVTDLSARVEAPFAAKFFGIPVNVINKPGGGFVIGSLEVYKAAPDGYTLLQGGNPMTTLLSAGIKNLPFNIMERTFICTTGIVPMLFIVPSNSPFKSLKDVEEEAKKNPENFTWSSQSTGVNDLVTRQFFKAIGVDVMKTRPVMARGGLETVAQTSGGHVKLGAGTISSTNAAINSGVARPLAITTKTRHPDRPDIPTTAELGYPTITGHNWVAIDGPPNLPSYVVDKWNKAMQEMVKDPEALSNLKRIGVEPFYKNAREYKEFVIKEMEEVKILWGLK